MFARALRTCSRRYQQVPAGNAGMSTIDPKKLFANVRDAIARYLYIDNTKNFLTNLGFISISRTQNQHVQIVEKAQQTDSRTFVDQRHAVHMVMYNKVGEEFGPMAASLNTSRFLLSNSLVCEE